MDVVLYVDRLDLYRVEPLDKRVSGGSVCVCVLGGGVDVNFGESAWVWPHVESLYVQHVCVEVKGAQGFWCGQAGSVSGVRRGELCVVLYVGRLDLYRVEPLDKRVSGHCQGRACWQRCALCLHCA